MMAELSMKKMYKAKLVTGGKWVYFDLGSVSKMNWNDGTFWHSIDEDTICQMVGLDVNGNEFYENDYVNSVMAGDYDPMIKNGIISFDEDEYQYICVDDGSHVELQDFAFEVTGENSLDG